ncbi:alpha-hydroxy acid oxidase [Variovorax sp. KK3]|uniref:alpha-hydroxy acid oxidase n=1 Tax=Variovorax sp. KK3 TaxID=1855728 RepID=UPI00097C2E6B|nr:alpha-hydroxy acid oxidase [Variovorax sp. KK3]
MMLRIADFRTRARARLPRFVFDYVDGAAEDEECIVRNQTDLRALHLLPTCLRDTTRLDTAIEVFGQRWASPIGIAPIGFAGLVRRGADGALAQAAASLGLPFVLSTASNERLESVRASAPSGNQWLQLYVMSDRRIAEQMVKRAKDAAYGALVLTVDVPVSGMRERDHRNGFKLPFRPGLRTLADLVAHPAWSLSMAIGKSPGFVNLSEGEAKASPQLQAALLARTMDRSLTWESLRWLRSLWDGPLLVKGLLHPEDAKHAIAHGVDGIVVSNHGGRQLDAAPSTISALPAVVHAVDGRVPVFVDSGFRRGSDVVKALALGARGVFIGRPAIWGLAANGQAGAAAALRLVSDEIERTMTLLGASRIDDLQPLHVHKNV